MLAGLVSVQFKEISLPGVGVPEVTVMLPCDNALIGLRIKTSAVMSRSAGGAVLPPVVTLEGSPSRNDQCIRPLQDAQIRPAQWSFNINRIFLLCGLPKDAINLCRNIWRLTIGSPAGVPIRTIPYSECHLVTAHLSPGAFQRGS